ncbi:MAG: TIGR03435 family protein [Terracidiphilus sp.]
MSTQIARRFTFAQGALAIAAALAFVPALVTAQTSTSSTSPQPPAWQTAAGGHMEFDVASIHLGEPGKFSPPTFALNIDDTAVPPGGLFKADFPLLVYIEFAYKLELTPEQRDSVLAHLPDWVHSQRFVIDAKTPIPDPSKDQIRLMMQSLLADRFKLAVHFEAREVPVYALVLAKPDATGQRLRPHAQGLACDAPWTAPSDPESPAVPPGGFVPKCGNVNATYRPDHTVLLGARNIPMDHIPLYLTSLYKFGRPVIDQTGLKGTFDFSLNWTPDPNSTTLTQLDDDSELQGPPFVDALKNQLGLKLKPTHAVVQTLFIDHVGQPSPN